MCLNSRMFQNNKISKNYKMKCQKYNESRVTIHEGQYSGRWFGVNSMWILFTTSSISICHSSYQSMWFLARWETIYHYYMLLIDFILNTFKNVEKWQQDVGFFIGQLEISHQAKPNDRLQNFPTVGSLDGDRSDPLAVLSRGQMNDLASVISNCCWKGTCYNFVLRRWSGCVTVWARSHTFEPRGPEIRDPAAVQQSDFNNS